jgi:Ankyrin repeat
MNPLQSYSFWPTRISSEESLESALIKSMDCCMLLEAHSSDDGGLFADEHWFNFAYGMKLLAKIVTSSQDIQNVKIWLNFLQRRAGNLNMSDTDGMTPLMAAVICDEAPLQFIRLMLACGADVSLKDENGCQVLHHALLGRPGYSSIFVDGGEAVDPDSYESVVGLVTCVITAGADIFALTNAGMTPMEVAIFCGTSLAFAAALERCGLSVDDTREESMRRKAEWKADRRRLYGAKRTAVDEEVLKTPSTEGLRKRRREICRPGDDE